MIDIKKAYRIMIRLRTWPLPGSPPPYSIEMTCRCGAAGKHKRCFWLVVVLPEGPAVQRMLCGETSEKTPLIFALIV